MSKHTKGPWKVQTRTDRAGYPVYSIEGEWAADKRNRPDEAILERLEANRQLIASAPDMYEALKDMALSGEHEASCQSQTIAEYGECEYVCRYCKAKSLLAKIDGEESNNES